MFASKNVRLWDKITFYFIICMILLVLMPPIGIIALGIFFPLFLVYALFVGFFDAIRSGLSK